MIRQRPQSAGQPPGQLRMLQSPVPMKLDPEVERQLKRSSLGPRESRDRLHFRDDQRLVIMIEHCTCPRPRPQTGLRGSEKKYVEKFKEFLALVAEHVVPGQADHLESLENPPLGRWPPVDKSVMARWQRCCARPPPSLDLPWRNLISVALCTKLRPPPADPSASQPHRSQVAPRICRPQDAAGAAEGLNERLPAQPVPHQHQARAAHTERLGWASHRIV